MFFKRINNNISLLIQKVQNYSSLQHCDTTFKLRSKMQGCLFRRRTNLFLSLRECSISVTGWGDAGAERQKIPKDGVGATAKKPVGMLKLAEVIGELAARSE